MIKWKFEVVACGFFLTSNKQVSSKSKWSHVYDIGITICNDDKINSFFDGLYCYPN